MQLPPTERTKQLDLTPELAERMSPPPTRVIEPASPHGKANGAERPLTAATAKWEPPTEFQARLAQAVGATRERPSGVVPAEPSSRPSSRPMTVADRVPTAAPSRPRSPSGVDETMDDVSADLPVAAAPATLVTPPPSFPSGRRGGTRSEPSVPRTLPGDYDDDDEEDDDSEGRQPSTHYASPVPDPTGPPARARATAPGARRDSGRDSGRESSRPHPSSAPPPGSRRDPSTRRSTAIEHADDAPRRSRGLLFVVLCFVLGAAIAAGWAWKMGKLGSPDGDDERYVARATDAMYKHRFVAPAGDNVRDITDEGLKKWPNDHRLLDIRMRAANELVSQATAQRSAGDIMEALRLARAAHELDPNDASAKRLVDQYDAELASFTTPTAPPLVKPPPVPVVNGKPVVPPSTIAPVAPASAAVTPFKVILDANVGAPRVGQTVEFTARVAPTKGTFEAPVFVISGPGLGGGASMPAQSPAPGVFKASFAFLEPGRFDVTFTTQADGKPLKAARSLSAGDSPKPPEPGPKPPSPSSPPTPAPTGSVKWM
jgi:hypothetical protein